MATMRVLVTGGTGFIGSNLALELAKDGHDVVATGASNEQRFSHPHIRILYGGVFGINWDAVGPVDALFHQGAIADTTVLDKEEMFRANVETSKKLFEYAVAHGCKNIVYASSTAVYGNLPPPYREDGALNPLNPYAESKAAQDAFAKEFGIAHPDVRIIGLRYCNVYGPRENHKGTMSSMVYHLARQMKDRNPKLFKHGEQQREFVYVDDVVRANIMALSASANGVVNCSTGKPRTFNELVEILNQVLGVSRIPEYIDNPFGATYQSHIECDVRKAKELFGFSAEFSLEQGVKAYFDSGFLPR